MKSFNYAVWQETRHQLAMGNEMRGENEGGRRGCLASN